MEKATNASAAVFEVDASGGLKLGGESGPPTLGVSGRFVTNGTSYVTVETL